MAVVAGQRRDVEEPVPLDDRLTGPLASNMGVPAAGHLCSGRTVAPDRQRRTRHLKHPHGHPHGIRRVILLCCMTAVMLPACRRSEQGASVEPAPPPNIVLIVVDTLRADRVGCFGADRATTPAIDGLATDGVVFDRAYSVAPWTMPSVASILTGLYPGAHGVDHISAVLPDQADTLAERLHRAGYNTTGIVSHVLLTRKFNFHQGFDTYLESEARGHDYVSTPGVVGQAEDALDKLTASPAPFFLFIHLFDPHYNYKRHPQYGFSAPRQGRLDGTQSMHELRTIRRTMTAPEIAYLRDIYDEEVRFTDDGIGRITEAIRKHGVYDKTAILVTADHGEEFLERGWIGHTVSLYNELVHVPLVLKLPDGRYAGTRLAAPISSVSITPTLLDLAGVGAHLALHGRSLQPLIAGAAAPPSTLYCEVDYDPPGRGGRAKRVRKKAVIAGDYKLIHDEYADTLELYNLGDDPKERHNLIEQDPKRARDLTARLNTLAKRTHEAPTRTDDVELSKDDLETLRGLGYVGN